MKEIILNVTLKLSGPIITGATAAGAFGLDLPFARYADQCYLPGSHVKGRLREALKLLAPHLKGFLEKDLVDWLGPEIPENNFDLPERGRFLFEDFVSQSPGGDGIRNRIHMDHERGAVEKGHYLVIESPFMPGEKVDFCGAIRFFCEEEVKARIRDIIETGLRWIPALGGQRSVGFGRLVSVSIEESSREVPSTVVDTGLCDALDLKLYIKAPFCVARPRIDENYFRAESIIPGAALKGCLANTLNQILGRKLDSPIDGNLPPPWKELGEAFDKIRFFHAFPTSEGRTSRPKNYPLSIVQSKDVTYDVALCPGPGLINDMAPSFAIDWKDKERKAVKKDLSGIGIIASPPRIMRVRTAMNEEKRRADEGRLFAYEMIDPQYYVWHGRVDLTKVPEEKRAAVRSQLEALFNFDLRYLGKTKVDVEVKSTVAPLVAVPPQIEDNLWVVTLQTPALMLEPDASLNDALVDESILFKKYNKFWDEVSVNTLELVRFFAQQRLLGGYLHYRFQKSKPYNSFLVTTEQSVFVLRPKGSGSKDAEKFLETCISQGLSLPAWAKDEGKYYGDSWKTCPFVAENGFGEIAINMDCHTDMKPDDAIYQEV